MTNSELVNKLHFGEKVERARKLIAKYYGACGDKLVVAVSCGKDSSVVWDLAHSVVPGIRGFMVMTRFKPKETWEFARMMVGKYPNLKIFTNDQELPAEDLYRTDPDLCCDLLKVRPVAAAIAEFGAKAWITGLRCTEGRTRTEYAEVEELDVGLIKLNPILLLTEAEVWQYIALYRPPVNRLYKEGYRSLGCAPCTHLVGAGAAERAGRWLETSKCGGECGIHTRPLTSQ